MSLALPTDPSLRETFEVADLVNWAKLPEYRRVVAGCRSTATQPGVHSAQGLALKANGDVVLIRVGKKGGVQTLWNFGNPVGTRW